MNSRPLVNKGVLVTRPARQSGELVAAIEAAGGNAHRFPVIDIVGRPPADIERDDRQLPPADIIVFVSSNAVTYGIEHIDAGNAQYAAIGAATRQAITAAGREVSICPESGFDSEHLLAHPELRELAGRVVRIVRGNGGRELLGETLQERGARVDYVETYRRCPHEFTAAELGEVGQAWTAGRIQFVIAMSVESLEFLLDALPPACVGQLDRASLVTPSKRVIQTAMDRAPGMRSVLAAGPGTEHMLAAIIDSRQQDTGATA